MDLENLRPTWDELRDALEKASRQRDQTVKERDQLRAEIARLKIERNQLQTKIAHLKAECDRLRDAIKTGS